MVHWTLERVFDAEQRAAWRGSPTIEWPWSWRPYGVYMASLRLCYLVAKSMPYTAMPRRLLWARQSMHGYDIRRWRGVEEISMLHIPESMVCSSLDPEDVYLTSIVNRSYP